MSNPPFSIAGYSRRFKHKLDQQRTNHAKVRQKTQSLLAGRIFDARSIRMTPSRAVKNGTRYRYYISSALIQGQPDKAATLNRVPAAEIETLIISALRKHLAREAEAEGPDTLNDKELISAHVARVDVKRDHLAVQLSVKPGQQSGEWDQPLSRKTRHARSCKPKYHGHPLAEDAVKTAA